jgi:hypothetical protein
MPKCAKFSDKNLKKGSIHQAIIIGESYAGLLKILVIVFYKINKIEPFFAGTNFKMS